MLMLKSEINLTPTDGMVEEANRGLEWRKEFGRGGTSVGISRARDISNRKQLSPSTVKRMKSFFARHEVDKKAEGFRPGEKGYPSNGRIAWALWGGDAGQSWANKKVDQIDRQDDKTMMTLEETKAVPPVQDLPIVDGDWDGGAARGRLRAWATSGEETDFSKYALGFGYYDAEDQDTFGAYKLPSRS